jgi:hypothetical protein
VLNLMFSILAVTLCFIPILLYWRKRLSPDKPFLVVALFWTINGITYIPEIFHWNWYNSAYNTITFTYNLLDAPLIFLFFYFFFRKKIFLFLIVAFIIFEAAINYKMGFNKTSSTIIIGLGSLICLALNIWSITLYLRSMQHTSSENVLVFVNAGFIFYYGLFTVIYFFNYVQFSRITIPYINFINYCSICLATGLISYGLGKFAVTQYREEHY